MVNQPSNKRHMMSRFLLYLFFFHFCYFSEAAPIAEVEIKGSVDRELNVERIDDGGVVNIFSKNEVRYRIVSNVDMDVMLTFTSQNDWFLVSDDKMNKIAYQGKFSTNGIETIINQSKISEIITKDKIIDRVCEFSIIFSVTNSKKQHPAGNFSDKVSISISSR